MRSAHPGGRGSAPEQTADDVANTKTATGNVFWAEFRTDAGVDGRPPARRLQHPSATGYGRP